MKEKIVLKKMKTNTETDLVYYLNEVNINELIGKEISFEFTGNIFSVYSNQKITKSFNQGFSFKEFKTLACCDICQLKPELCHFRKGTCRQEDWAEDNCFIEHIVYLSNTTGVKVGITRGRQYKTRWADQGAREAIIFARTPDRYTSGLIEVELKKHISDKTNWRSLLKGEFSSIDLVSEKNSLAENLSEDFYDYLAFMDEDMIVHNYNFPVNNYLEKAKTWNFDKEEQKLVSGVLNGIVGQYLLIGDKALNVRKFNGYEVVFQF